MPASPWWTPERHADRRGLLRARAGILQALRAWFTARDFVEVETSALAVSPGNETHLHAFATTLHTPAGEEQPFYLRTSPEFACKKLLAAGEPKIFEVAQVYRDRERGPLHHPVFTLIEWYRAREPYEALMDDCAAILAESARIAGVKEFSYRDRRADPFAVPERLTVAGAFTRFAKIDLLAMMEGGEPDRGAFAAAATRAGVRIGGDDTWGDIFSRIIVERVEPQLGLGRPTILYEYPAPQAALARRKPDDPRVAERFELYVCGVELANAFGELTDPVEQRRRFAADMAEKQRLYGERYPIDDDFLAALAVMPQASGIALGFDRLVMLATGAAHIEHVIWTPLPE
ncbi:MAG TPA: EF-P lysine aminoacylase EpmA [Pseudolabrys sp.]|nr:EF-P lysine aminoacylase EpmA [Pseudolabrys sp.]